VGQIVGWGASSDFGLTAVVSASPTAPPIALPGEGRPAQAHDINKAGWIVGAPFDFFNGVSSPVLWTPVRSAPLFLHARGTGLFLNAKGPTDATADFRDSASLKFAGGNVWKTIGTWSDPETGSPRSLTDLGDLHVWRGLKNSDDQGTRFDLLAEVLRNGSPLHQARSTASGASRGTRPRRSRSPFLSARSGRPSSVPMTRSPCECPRGSARTGTVPSTGGHANAVGLRLYFDATSRPARFEVLE
jgi:hypothetical protein